MAFPTLNVTPGTGQTINTTPNAGQATMANSLPVAIASDQSPLSVTGAFWQATQPVSQSGTWNVAVSNASLAITAAALPLPTGAATDSNLTTIAGAAGTAAPSLATSASGLIGWLRKIVDTLLSTLTVSVSNFPATQAVSGTFWQATQPVSGTFWQATQPVSASSLPLPAGAATSAKQPALGTAGTPSTDVLSVQGAASMTALKVDGSGVTQPVSAASLPLPAGASTAAKQPALGTAGAASADVLTVQGVASMTALKVDGSAVTQPVSGTFFQAIQPVSGTVTANAGTNLNTSALALDATFTGGTARTKITDGTNNAAVKAASTAAAAADPSLVVAVSPNSLVAKGTQGTNALPTQDLKDSGRTAVVLNASGIATIVSSTLVTIQKYVAGTVTTGVTEYIVTTGKTLRVQKVVITFRPTTPSTTATFVSCTWSLRRNTTTLAAASSLVGTATAMVSTANPSVAVEMTIPDGLEFAAGDHIGFTQASSATTGTFDLTLVGYEY